jgi:Tol biopolymer transport system component
MSTLDRSSKPPDRNGSAVEHSADAAPRKERLESWKEIAAYLGRGVTTVQRWEQQEGLPVHRLPHAKKGSIFAIKSELDEWRRARTQLGPVPPDPVHHDAVVDSPPQGVRAVPSAPRPPVRLDRRTGVLLVALVALAVVGVAMSRVLGRTSSVDAVAFGESSVVPRPLANDAADEMCPSLSPDGGRVVYFWKRERDRGLYIKSIDGPPRRLATGDAGKLNWCGSAKWSPAGDLIAFLATGDGDSKNVWVISPAGGRPRLLTSASGIGLAWTPDGQSLAFVDRNSPGEPFSIFLISLRGGPRRRLTAPPLGTFGDTYCAFSPDGRRLAVVRYPNRYQSDLFIVRLDDPHGERIERLTTGAAGMEGVDWSPDGRAIVFGSHQGLWKVPLTGARKPRRVAAFSGAAFYPTFSRTTTPGSSIRLAYQADMTDVNIWRWDPTRRETRKIAGSTWYDDFPAVSPSGDRVAFASNRTGENEIWVAGADGSNPRQVTFHRGPVVTSPAWSPDGKRLAFSSEVGGNRDIYVIRPDGSESTRITTAPSEETNPSWSPDGRSIYFRSNQAGIGQLWKVPAFGGGSPIRVTTGEALQGFPSPDGRLVYFVRGAEAPGLWSVPVDGGRETFVLPDVRDDYWAVADSGIFFLVPWQEGSTVPHGLRFFAFSTGRVSSLPAPPGGWGSLDPGFSAARDGRFVLWTRNDNPTRDLMLVDPWAP